MSRFEKGHAGGLEDHPRQCERSGPDLDGKMVCFLLASCIYSFRFMIQLSETEWYYYHVLFHAAVGSTALVTNGSGHELDVNHELILGIRGQCLAHF